MPLLSRGGAERGSKITLRSFITAVGVVLVKNHQVARTTQPLAEASRFFESRGLPLLG